MFSKNELARPVMGTIFLVTEPIGKYIWQGNTLIKLQDLLYELLDFIFLVNFFIIV